MTKIPKLLIALVLSVLLFGQALAATLTINVTDEENKPVQGARVELTPSDNPTSVSDTTGAGGNATFRNINEGFYSYTAKKGDASGSGTVQVNGDTQEGVQIKKATSGSGTVSVTSRDLGGTYSNIGQYLADVLKWAARIGTLAAVLMIVFAGNKIVTSGGNPEAVSEGKEMIVGALLGLLVIFLLGATVSWFEFVVLSVN